MHRSLLLAFATDVLIISEARIQSTVGCRAPNESYEATSCQTCCTDTPIGCEFRSMKESDIATQYTSTGLKIDQTCAVAFANQTCPPCAACDKHTETQLLKLRAPSHTCSCSKTVPWLGACAAPNSCECFCARARNGLTKCPHLEEDFNGIAWSQASVEPEPDTATEQDVDAQDDAFAAASLLVASSQNADQGMRLMAVKTLAQIAEDGDPRAIRALLSCLQDADADVRLAAVDALMQLTEFSNQQVVVAASVQVSAADPFIRRAAMEALKELSQLHDTHPITGSNDASGTTTTLGMLPLIV